MENKRKSILAGTLLAALFLTATVLIASNGGFSSEKQESGTNMEMSLASNGMVNHVAFAAIDDKCGEGKCGGDTEKKKENKEGETQSDESETTETKCGGDSKDAESKEGESDAKENKCGEGKCGDGN